MVRFEDRHRDELVKELVHIVREEEDKSLKPSEVQYLLKAIPTASCRDLIGLISLAKAIIETERKNGKNK